MNARPVKKSIQNLPEREAKRLTGWLLGILLLGMFHAMTENYLIAIFERLGGGSSNVGVALFIPTVVEAVECCSRLPGICMLWDMTILLT